MQAFIEHRREREAQILACIGSGVGLITDMVPKMYLDTPEFMYPAAARSVLAAIEYLVQGELARTVTAWRGFTAGLTKPAAA